jgi:hypothetical protein
LNDVFSVIKQTGRRVTLDLHASEARPQLALAAIGLGIPLTVPPGGKLGNADHDLHTFISDGAIESLPARMKALLAAGTTAIEIDAPSAQPGENPRFYQTLSEAIAP